jgi:molecular chaperone DnaJ
VTFAQAALGATVEVPTPEGGQTKLNIPEGTQAGATLRIRGQGVPNLGSRGRGDIHVTVRVLVPTKLNADQRKLIEQLGKTLPSPEVQASGEKERSFKSRIKDILG